jgi:hypothetical protein
MFSGPERPRVVIQGEEIEMKKFALLLSLIFVAGVASAQEPAKPAAPAKPAHHAKPATKSTAVNTHDVTTEVVAIDSVKHTITLKGEPTNTTAPVEGKALTHLKSFKAGEKVTVTCRDNDKGEHQAVTEIKAATSAPAVQK